MNGRKYRVEGQLALELETAVPPAVERARALRKAAGLPTSLVAPEVLRQVLAIVAPFDSSLRGWSGDRMVERQAPSRRTTRRPRDRRAARLAAAARMAP